MNMLSLLSAGKSLVGLKDTGKQYRMLDVRSLPKFGASGQKLQAPSSKLQRSSNDQTPNQIQGRGQIGDKGSPSPPTPLPQERGADLAEVTQERETNSAGAPLPQEEKAARSWFAKLRGSTSAQEKFQTSNSKLQGSPKLQGSNAAQADSAGVALPRKNGTDPALAALPRGSWFARVKARFSGAKATRTNPRFGGGPVQYELSLDNVKVLRNDLSDTDFEVIAKPVPPAKPSAPAAQDAPAQPRPASEPSREKIWNRVTTLLGAGQT